mmetsp:Transcript_49227/g.154481  ORF Transcript_49227/g.154481 Transcript_49227/m.154481 type:complete len:101 (+) Transcript_49227:243-545(+)
MSNVPSDGFLLGCSDAEATVALLEESLKHSHIELESLRKQLNEASEQITKLEAEVSAPCVVMMTAAQTMTARAPEKCKGRLRRLEGQGRESFQDQPASTP